MGSEGQCNTGGGVNMGMINVHTSSGDAWIDLHSVVAVVCHLPNRDNFNVDIHVSGGTIFTVRDTNKDTYEWIISEWQTTKEVYKDGNK